MNFEKIITEIMASCYHNGLDQAQAQSKAIDELSNAWEVPEVESCKLVNEWTKDNYYEF